MTEEKKKRFSRKDMVLVIWFLIALIQVHIAILLIFLPIGNIKNLIFWNGIVMLVEGGLACWVLYSDTDCY
jgi:hypothetical protein